MKLKKEKAPPREDLYKAIIAYRPDSTTIAFAKYHRIKADSEPVQKKFVAFVQNNFKNATHINYYGGISGRFIRQYKLI